MTRQGEKAKKRKTVGDDEFSPKRSRIDNNEHLQKEVAGKIIKVFMRNFMCHEAFEIILNQNVNFIVGANGSGKSAILTAVSIGLGMKAKSTDRGSALQEFVQKDKGFAIIEITISNLGPLAFKPEIYGETITVQRRIGSSPGYKLSASNGKVVATKRHELSELLLMLNIQVGNPIAVMNQDVSRTFLVSLKPEAQYQLFMKATQLDKIGHNYKTAQITSHEVRELLRKNNLILSKYKAEIEELKDDIQKLERANEFRKDIETLEKELLWAKAIEEEKKFEKAKEDLNKAKQEFEDSMDSNSADSKIDDIDNKIKNLNNNIVEIEKEIEQATSEYSSMRKKCNEIKDSHSSKIRQWRSVQNNLKRFESDLEMLRNEVKKLEESENEKNQERNDLKSKLVKIEQKLDEVQAVLRTKLIDKMHLEADKLRLSQDLSAAKIDNERLDNQQRKIKSDLNTLKQQTDNDLMIFGRHIPRLLKRIHEDSKKGRFKKSPIGPLGSYIKLKDSTWASAIENYFGINFLTSFCVDNSTDAKILNDIMKEIYLNERTPQIICSSFFNKVHNVSKNCIQSSDHSSLLDMLIISNPVVTNCLIDQREIECIMLIPTSQEACHIMSNASRVPRNCKRAITKNADNFYPDPQYRTYAGRSNLRAKILQVSTIQVIEGLEEELAQKNKEITNAREVYENLGRKIKNTNDQLSTVSQHIHKLQWAQEEYKKEINNINDKIQITEKRDVTIFKTEITELEKKIQESKQEEDSLRKEERELGKLANEIEGTVKKIRETVQDRTAKIEPIKEEIKSMNDRKKVIREEAQQAINKRNKLRHIVQSMEGKFDAQKRVYEKTINDAVKKSERIETKRLASEIHTQIAKTKAKITAIEKQFKSKEELVEELKLKESEHGSSIEFSIAIEKCNEEHLERLKGRRNMYHEMKNRIGERIQSSFSDILKLRKYKGSITIDHHKKILNLIVRPPTGSQKADTKSLSGGERSYSTVAFILALWECTNLPFHFLDEFDVFMDKVNRRVIMDLLLDHARTHPRSQFIFLTPQETSSILPENYVTIHHIAPPKRMNQT